MMSRAEVPTIESSRFEPTIVACLPLQRPLSGESPGVRTPQSG